jgi:hypothetical protein
MRHTWASRRPGRSSAASIISGRLVAAITNTPWSPSTPSSAVSSWFTTLSVTPVESCPLFRGHSVSVFVLLYKCFCVSIRTFVLVKRSEKLVHSTLSVKPIESCPLRARSFYVSICTSVLVKQAIGDAGGVMPPAASASVFVLLN